MPEDVPVTAGLNRNLIVQLPPGARTPGQAFESTKKPPVMVFEVIVRALCVPLVIVTAKTVLRPWTVFPKSSLSGEMPTTSPNAGETQAIQISEQVAEIRRFTAYLRKWIVLRNAFFDYGRLLFTKALVNHPISYRPMVLGTFHTLRVV